MKRRADVRRFRRRGRRGGRLTKICFATATLVLAGAAAVSVSPLTALRSVQVEGADAAVAAQVRHALSGQLGRPLALIDRSRVHDALSALTRIGGYSLLLEPPATMVVRVVERVPLAAVRRGGGYAVVDADGITLQVSSATPSLPLVTSAVGSAGFRAAVDVIQALPRIIDERISTVSATTTDDVSFTLRGRKGATVVWGDHSHAALKARVLAALLKAAPHASRYDVSSPNDAVTR
jgi:cell division protein FtsQ